MPPLSPGLWNRSRIQAQARRALDQLARALPRPWGQAAASSQIAISQLAIPAAQGNLISQPPSLSIIIPTLNEADNLPRVLAATPAGVEVVVVDGGSTDRSREVARAWGARVIESAPGRSHQQNQGAAAATGSILLFLHADTRLPEGFDAAIRETLAQPGVVAGAFRLTIDGPGRGLRWVEWGVNLRSRYLQMPYGDQALFLWAEVFDQLGGFPDLPMMEDFELVRRLRTVGRVAIAPRAVVTSDRRWRNLGILRTTLTNQAMVIGYLCGIAPPKLARWYRRLGKPR